MRTEPRQRYGGADFYLRHHAVIIGDGILEIHHLGSDDMYAVPLGDIQSIQLDADAARNIVTKRVAVGIVGSVAAIALLQLSPVLGLGFGGEVGHWLTLLFVSIIAVGLVALPVRLYLLPGNGVMWEMVIRVTRDSEVRFSGRSREFIIRDTEPLQDVQSALVTAMEDAGVDMEFVEVEVSSVVDGAEQVASWLALDGGPASSVAVQDSGGESSERSGTVPDVDSVDDGGGGESGGDGEDWWWRQP